MSSEPPFEHPPDHRRYGDPPQPPPRSMPTILTPAFKMGCGGVFLFLLSQCCVCTTVTFSVGDAMNKRFNAVDHQLNEINKS